MTQRRILLIIGGGIAAYKSLELVRELARRGIGARCILTNAAKQFVTPMSVSALSGEKVYDDLFSLTDEVEMGHIELSRSADLLVVAPATADLMAKAANGLADDLASTTLLATDKPVLMAPAMNVRMWSHPATRRNHRTLQNDGIVFVGPDDGEMACGEYGAGRMAEPREIASEIERWYAERPRVARAPALPAVAPQPASPVVAAPQPPAGPPPLRGVRAVVTAGPTREPIDPVRYLSNHSSGKQGYAIAAALGRLGAQTTLISGPTELAPPGAGVQTVPVETAAQMLAAVEAALPSDVFISVAAVADWRPATAASEKLKIKGQGGGPIPLALEENPDILRAVAGLSAGRPELVIGFAAETHDVLAHARAKRVRKGCDWIVANDVSGDVMGGDRNQVVLVRADGEEAWPPLSKAEVAFRLAERIAEVIGPRAARAAE